MMTDKMIDEALVEILRAKRALEALRKARRIQKELGESSLKYHTGYWTTGALSAAAKRATLDLSRTLAKLRGRNNHV